ncbi:hypothetical protein [Autumnicola edwardsiae]|uniref:GLPGLI family protein n=1 Tax=Autumnicola edwardsiae TaxID=3075594 RepID=A0ABU3CVB9_9FLAO|nr:hypothetical protein [Zunongwangia sp. F297]MDT0650188.1 hypothetical protein [Zunongwangia sp. F297]
MRYLLVIFFLITTKCFSQKKYSFDYLIEYNFRSYSDTTSNKKIYYLTNSKDNSYFAKIESFDTLNFDLELIVQDKIWTKMKLSRKDFINAKFINLTCNSSLIYKNYFKFRTKEYKFEIIKDTILESLPLNRYKLEYVGKRKRKKSFPVGTNVYIIANSTDFHSPILTHSTAFEEWKEKGKIPNGIFKEKIFYDFKNNIDYKYILNNYSEINKTIVIPDNCLEN